MAISMTASQHHAMLGLASGIDTVAAAAVQHCDQNFQPEITAMMMSHPSSGEPSASCLVKCLTACAPSAALNPTVVTVVPGEVLAQADEAPEFAFNSRTESPEVRPPFS